MIDVPVIAIDGNASSGKTSISKMLSKKEDALEGLNLQIFQLSELLSLEKKENKDLNDTISVLNEKLNSVNLKINVMDANVSFRLIVA